MAKPYRRKKGGKLIGNFRATINGRDLNLETKDAGEAHARARLAAKGKWPPIDAAAAAAQAALDPAAPAQIPEPSVYVEPPVAVDGGGPHAEGSTATSPPPSPETLATPEPLADAARAAAGEVSGVEGEKVTADQIAADESIEAQVRAEMAKLGGPDGDLFERGCDGIGAFALWAESKAIKYGVKWTLGIKLEPAQPEPTSLARKCLKHSFKALALEYFPTLAQNLSPGWGIVIGLGFGAVDSISGATLQIEGKVVKVGDMVAADAAPPPDAPVEPPQPPASA